MVVKHESVGHSSSKAWVSADYKLTVRLATSDLSQPPAFDGPFERHAMLATDAWF